MGLFDIFNTDDQKQAAQDQIAGINNGQQQASSAEAFMPLQIF